jgi:hypothetical protein
MSSVSVTLPGGLWRDGEHFRRAILRPLTGADEEMLLERGDEPPAQSTNRLLDRCLLVLEGARGGTLRAAAAELTLGDQEALLLHLRRITLGDRMQCVLSCPGPECGEKLDLELAASGLLLPPYDDPRPVLESVAVLGGAEYRLRFRLPTGGDRVAAAEHFRRVGPEAAVELLAERCLESVEGLEEGAPPPPRDELLSTLSAALAEADPQAEILLELPCPECGETFTARFDALEHLLAELGTKRQGFYQQVHTLALHYHWGEAEILALTPRKRRLYLDLLAEERAASAAPARAAGGWG